MPRARTIKSFFFVSLLLACLRTPAQTLSLRQLSQRAGIIFAGTVTRIQPNAQQVQITFRVDQGIRGVPSKHMVTIREWAGLWTFGPRYGVGEHLVLFLYPPSSTGLTSPVGGTIGRISIDDRNRVIIPPDWTYPGRVSLSPSSGSGTTVISNNKRVLHSPSAEGAPQRLTVKQFTRLLRKAE